MTTKLLTVAALVLCACASRSPRQAAYTDDGPLQVRGAPPSAPGPTMFRALRDDPAARKVVAANGEPDTLEVLTVPGRGRRIVFTYRRGRYARPRRVVIEPSERAPAARARARSPRVARGTAAPPAPATPNARQRLECPIDPERPDCRALCAGRAAHEWCP